MSKGPLALLVDDENAILEELSWHLGQRGWRVLVAADGNSGRDLWNRHSAELRLIVADVRMPGLPGQTLVRQIAEERMTFKPALFIMTAYDDLSREDAHVLGADAIFQKPFRVRELVAAAEHFVKIADRQEKNPPVLRPAGDSGSGEIQ